MSGLITGVRLSDSHNGFRGIPKKTLESIQLRENGFAHASEILEAVRRSRLRYVEVSTTIRYTDYSRAKGQRMRNAFNIVVDLIVRKLFS